MSQHKNNNEPIDVIRDGALKASTWENEGKKGVYYTTKLAKTYEDKDGNLRDTQNFSPGELLKVAELARQAYTRCNELRRENAPARNQEAQTRDEQPRSEAREAWEGHRNEHRPEANGNRQQQRDYRGPSQ